MSTFKEKAKACAKKVGESAKKNGLFWVIGTVLLLYTVILLVIFFWGFSTSFKEPYMEYEGNKWGFPKSWDPFYYKLLINGKAQHPLVTKVATVEYYRKTKNTIWALYGNSLAYAVGCAFFATACPCLTAYVVAKFGKKYPKLNIYTTIVLVCMIIPIVGSTPSEIRVAKAVGTYGSIFGLWIMKGYFIGMYFLIFQATFKGMPDGYAEAAKIDGAGHFTVFFKIYLPLTVKMFATIMLIQGVAFWNDYQTPLLYLNSVTSSHTLALFLYNLRFASQDKWFTFVPGLLAATMLLAIPILLVFIFLNKYIMGNLSLGGLKE